MTTRKCINKMSNTVQFVYLLIVLNLLITQIEGRSSDGAGVLIAEVNGTKHGAYCIMYNPRFKPLPGDKQQAKSLPLLNLTSDILCDDPTEEVDFTGYVVAVARGNCSFSEKALRVQQFGGEAVLVVSRKSIAEPIATNETDYGKINIVVALITRTSFEKMASGGESVRVRLFAPIGMDYNLIIIWLIACGTVTVGGLWSGHLKYKQHLRKRRRYAGGPGGAPSEPADDTEDKDPDTLDIDPKYLLVFVAMMCAMLLSLYFFYDYLVYVVIGLFTLASSMALYSCTEHIVYKLTCNCCKGIRIPANRIPYLGSQPEVRSLLLGMCCLGVGVFWAVERHASYAWVLQDLLGVMFCINMLKTVRMPSLKACTVLLILLFFYDIFFVFITPIFTKHGESVMVDVATGAGGHSGEMLPMVLMVPRICDRDLAVCQLPFSLLGFGDILVPGLLISYNYGFDLKANSKRIYFISTVVAYGVGLIITFIALAIMHIGQPALLYLVPCTLLTTLVIAWCRGELKYIWRGHLEEPTPTLPTPSMADEEAITNGGPGVLESVSEEGPRQGAGSIQQDDDVHSVNSDSGEDQALLKK